jgi:hypothetical protein
VLRIRRVIGPVMAHPVRAPMVPVPPICEMPVPPMMAPPVPGMVHPCPAPMPCHPWVGPMMPWNCPLPAHAHVERVPVPPQATVPGMEVSTEVRPAAARMRITPVGKQVCLASPHLEACCDSITPLGDGRVLLQGEVTVHFRVPGQPAKIQAARIIVNLADGSYEVNPLQMVPHGLHEILHKKPILFGDKVAR